MSARVVTAEVTPPAPLRRVVKVHPPIGLSTLFRPLGKFRERLKLHVRYEKTDGTALVFSAREALGVQEQSLMLVLLEIAGEQFGRRPLEAVMDGSDRGEEGRKLLATMNSKLMAGDVPEGVALHLKFSWRELNARLGSGNGGALIRTRGESLRRLCEVVVWQEKAGGRATSQSFLAVWTLGDDQRVHVALNFRLASALMGGQYAQVSLSERFSLRSDTALAVHAFLSTCIRHGHTLAIRTETLAGRLWPDAGDAVPEGTRRRRLCDVRRALSAIGVLPSWSVGWTRGCAEVTRLPMAARDMTHEPSVQVIAIQGAAPEPVRDATLPRHPLDKRTAFGERPSGENFLPDKHLLRYDASELLITNE